jgi:hypothetical protein
MKLRTDRENARKVGIVMRASQRGSGAVKLLREDPGRRITEWERPCREMLFRWSVDAARIGTDLSIVDSDGFVSIAWHRGNVFLMMSSTRDR